MNSLNWQLNELQKHHREGSFSTQNSRKECLSLVAKQLRELGYNRFQLTSLKARHVSKLIEKWQAESLANGTIKNRMTHIRWWARKVNRAQVIPGNDALGIERRVTAINESKAVILKQEHLSNITDTYIQDSLKLQAVFGLRREESIKFMPQYADRGTHLELKGSWCKGNRVREIPINTLEQRNLIDELTMKYGSASLIPADRRYVDQLNIYKNAVPASGLGKGHGLRHHYAQIRYLELSGQACPAAGGQHQKDMTPEQREADRAVRLQISAELGHAREQITAVYLGS